MYRHFKSHLTSKRMAQEMFGVQPYIQSGELVLNELVSRPKFFKAAWMLGAKYVPQHVGKRVNLLTFNILTSNDICQVTRLHRVSTGLLYLDLIRGSCSSGCGVLACTNTIHSTSKLKLNSLPSLKPSDVAI